MKPLIEDGREVEPGTKVTHRHGGNRPPSRNRVGVVVRSAKPSVGVPAMTWVRWEAGRPPVRVPARHLVEVSED